LIGDQVSTGSTSRRLDQWLWFARLVKRRSLASRLCVAGGVTVNGVVVRKANHTVRAGDIIALPHGAFLLSIRVLSLGARRGPAAEARMLYQEATAPVPLAAFAPTWTPLLAEDDPSLIPE
jgi:ribosome-associated heat shock protein Hsp15